MYFWTQQGVGRNSRKRVHKPLAPLRKTDAALGNNSRVRLGAYAPVQDRRTRPRTGKTRPSHRKGARRRTRPVPPAPLVAAWQDLNPLLPEKEKQTRPIYSRVDSSSKPEPLFYPVRRGWAAEAPTLVFDTFSGPFLRFSVENIASRSLRPVHSLSLGMPETRLQTKRQCRSF